jgi:single-stranded DNA-specific DHH superfamily exonuclease
MGKIEEWIKESENIVVVFHIDTDGICSGVLMYHLIKKLGKDIAGAVPCVPTLPDAAVRRIISHEPDLVIFVDLAVDQRDDKVREIADNRRVVLIDHHPIHNDMNSSNIIHMNPMFESEKYYPASKYIYDIFKLKEFDWIAAAGLLGDSGDSDWQDFVECIKKRYSIEGDLRKSEIGELDELVSSGRVVENMDGALAVFETLKKSKDVKDFLARSKQLKEWNKEVKKELKRAISRFEKNKEVVDDIVFYNIRSRLRIASVLATILSMNYPDKTLLIYKTRGEVVKVHLRRNDGKVDMGSTVKSAAKGLRNASGGGHRNAAGAQVMEEDFEEFKIRFMNLHDKIK